MADVCFGPFIARAANPRVITGFHSLPCAIEFVTASHTSLARLYHKIRETTSNFSRGVGDFFIHESEIPCEVRYLRGFSSLTPQGLLLPLDDVLLSLYRKFSCARPLITVLEELRAVLPPTPSMQPQSAQPSILTQAIADKGYHAELGRPYGRHIDLYFKWAPAQDRHDPRSALHLTLGRLEFRPKPNFTLNTGRWMPTRRDLLGMILRDHLKAISPGPLLNLLSDHGVAKILQIFPWSPLTLMTTEQARNARVSFIRQNPDLWTDHIGLADALVKAGLYSEGTGVHHVRKSIPKLLRIALEEKPPGGNSNS